MKVLHPPAPPPSLPQGKLNGLLGEMELMAYHVTLDPKLRAEVDDTLAAIRDLQECTSLEAVVEKMDEFCANSLYAAAALAEKEPKEADFAALLLKEAASLGHLCASVELAAKTFPSQESLAGLDGLTSKLHPKAQFLFATVLEEGAEGVEPDPVLAKQWLNASASTHYPPATFALGLGYEREKDFPNAYHFYLEGAERGHVDSQLALGKVYLLGSDLLTPPSNFETLEKAEKWLRTAARSGSTEATFLLERRRAPQYPHGLSV